MCAPWWVLSFSALSAYVMIEAEQWEPLQNFLSAHDLGIENFFHSWKRISGKLSRFLLLVRNSLRERIKQMKFGLVFCIVLRRRVGIVSECSDYVRYISLQCFEYRYVKCKVRIMEICIGITFNTPVHPLCHTWNMLGTTGSYVLRVIFCVTSP